MKYLILLFLNASAVHALAQKAGCDSIVWNNNRKLTWDDFKGNPDGGTNTGAHLYYNFSRAWAARGTTLKTKMVCFISPCKSWVKGKRSSELLRHEQGNFDIAEYSRRTYNKNITEAQYSPAILGTIMRSTYTDALADCEALEKAYEGETKHGQDEQAQVKWDHKINDLLNTLHDYAMEEVVIELPKKANNASPSFSRLLERAQLTFTPPAGMIEVPVIANGQMNYEYALKLQDKEYEVRYAIRPLDTAVAEYEAWKNKKGDEIRADPNNLDKPAFTAIIMNISGGKRDQPADFPNQAIRNCFNADWGCINVCQPVGDFGKGYAYCLAMAIHKDNVADAYIFFMTNDRSNLTKLLDIAFYSLKFNQ